MHVNSSYTLDSNTCMSSKVNQVDWLYIVQMLANIPTGLFVLYFVDIIGLKKSFWMSTTLNVVGTCVRLGGVIE